MGDLKGIGLFGLQVIGLVSSGETENIDDIISHLESNDVVEYLFNKYNAKFAIRFDNNTYDNSQLNKYFSNYSFLTSNDARRKYMVSGQSNGLLFLLALLMDKVETESIKWTVD